MSETIEAVQFQPKQIKLNVEPYHYQAAFFADVKTRALDNEEVGKWYLYSSPTGTGKSFMFLGALGSDPFGWGITPRIEIIIGMLEKCGENVEGLSTEKIVDLAWQYRITTPVRFRNALARGVVPFMPWRLYVDEAHHMEADTYKDIHAFLPNVIVVGLTATPFRGTAKSTREFNEKWDAHIEVMDIPQAVKFGVWELPEAIIWPLVDDDEIELSNGEFNATSAGAAGITRADDLVNRILAAGFIKNTWTTTGYDDEEELVPIGYNTPTWDKPTIFAVSSAAQAYDLRDRCEAVGIPVTTILQENTRAERDQAFRDVLACRTALIQISVVSEGVDLAIRRIIDMRPCGSPVFWLQLLGRSTRPRKNKMQPHSEYICCNRNLERHGYLMQGMFPPSQMAAAQTAFAGRQPSVRAGARAVGLEGVGRVRPVSIRFKDGTTGAVYNLYKVDGFKKTEIAILLHPCRQTPIAAIREIAINPQTRERQYGRWAQVTDLPDTTAYASAPSGVITEKQQDSWNKYAGNYGLDNTVKPTRKNIQAYYLLRDLRIFDPNPQPTV